MNKISENVGIIVNPLAAKEKLHDLLPTANILYADRLQSKLVLKRHVVVNKLSVVLFHSNTRSRVAVITGQKITSDSSDFMFWSVERRCEETCQEGCNTVGERVKLFLCRSCCNGYLCNYGNTGLKALPDENYMILFTVNGDRYGALITNFFIPELNNHDVKELWFQQDGATCHTARATIDLLKDTFGDRLISRFGPVNWPPRSCDLTPLDYFLWGYVKSLVYADKPQTLDHLQDSIRRVIADIRPQMLEKVIENWTSRLDYIRASRGSPMPEIIFKM
ncbi:uncharacterized protein TNCV_1168241 [Trichonephila clavipes]|uniref:Transposase n=1 Tax=Trichonephila clavipes TaxID=2585209 RepID=A0A8X6VT95_TRICX|nr:uncharacterized protein TNCV_1168241 [Trichonephila clavipes]